jgi:3-isopropylmalate dehydrogenase
MAAYHSQPLNLCVLNGDGIGPEVVEAALLVLHTYAKAIGLTLNLRHALIGGCAYDATGHPFPAETLAAVQASDAVLLGAVGGPQYDELEPSLRPEQGLLQIRKALGLYANLRPVATVPALAHASTLKPDVLAGVDMVIVRELTGGLYFGQPKAERDDDAVDTLTYTRAEIERIAHVAFKLAQSRGNRVCSVDKANVLATSRLWRRVVNEVHQAHYPEVALSHMYVDNAAMQLIRDPRQFDVLLTENTFGDILSDEASMLSASLGMLPSVSLGAPPAQGQAPLALFEPCHGSAPTIAGQGIANPIATILCLSSLLHHTLGQTAHAALVEQAVAQVLAAGHRTADIAEAGTAPISTMAMAQHVAEALQGLLA